MGSIPKPCVTGISHGMLPITLTRLVTAPEDRILVLFGAGHQYLLQQFFRESGRFVVDSAQTYFI